MRSDNDPVMGARSGANGDASSTGSGGAAAKAKEGAEQLKNKALERVGDVRERANSQRERVADRVRRVSSAVRAAGDQLRQEDDTVAHYADLAGERIERAAEYLSSAEPRQVVRDVEDFARRQPAVFFGGAFLLGLAAARFLKSSQRSGDDMPEMSREFFEDEDRFARSYTSASEVRPSPDVFDASLAEGRDDQGAIQATPTIDVGMPGTDGISSGSPSIGGTGQDGWDPERR